MSNLRDAAIILGVSLVAVTWFQNRPAPQETLMPAPEPVQLQAATAPQPARSSGGTLTLPSRNGQYWADARVNFAPVDFLVDTGASSVALRLEDALAAGIRERDLRFDVEVETANGRTYAALTRLDTITVGPITLDDVEALVVRDGLSVSLLGMSFLNRLQKFEVGAGQLTLTL